MLTHLEPRNTARENEDGTILKFKWWPSFRPRKECR